MSNSRSDSPFLDNLLAHRAKSKIKGRKGTVTKNVEQFIKDFRTPEDDGYHYRAGCRSYTVPRSTGLPYCSPSGCTLLVSAGYSTPH